MKLTDEEEALRAGAFGRAAQWAIEHQIKVGRYLGARDFVVVSQAHVMADTESLGAAGVEWLETLARLPAPGRSDACAFRPSPIRAAPTLRPRISSSSSPGWSTSNAVRSVRWRRWAY